MLIKILDKVPLIPLVIMVTLLALAPFNSQSHLIQKLLMLSSGSLSSPMDMADLFLHSILLILLPLKLVAIVYQKNQQG